MTITAQTQSDTDKTCSKISIGNTDVISVENTKAGVPINTIIRLTLGVSIIPVDVRRQYSVRLSAGWG